jgi:pyruvate/2-oxoacid:ferredoxin oxidoreductase alpha subunit
MSKIFVTGNAACAPGVKAANVDFEQPTPLLRRPLWRKITSYIADGPMQPKSFGRIGTQRRQSVAAGAAVGARVFTANLIPGRSISRDPAYAAGGRLSLVMANVNRAVCAPWCLYVDL